MDLKRYLGKIKNKVEKPKQEHETVQEIKSNVVEEIESEIIEEVGANVKKTLDFVDPKKDPHEYLKRYLQEPKYKDWFNRNYPNNTIYNAIGLSMSDYLNMKRELFPESENINEEGLNNEKKSANTDFTSVTTHKQKTV